MIAAMLAATVIFGPLPPECPRACATNTTPPVVYIDPTQLGPGGLPEVLTHEMGHVFDYTLMNDESRHTFALLMGTGSRPWRSPPNSLHEQFAEAYRLCKQFGPRYNTTSGSYQAGYNYYPSPKTYHRVCRLIQRVEVGR